MPDFLLNALFVGLGIALVAGPLGSFAVWRKMAYFGDTLAHSALLGVAFGLILSININFAIVTGCLIIALVLVILQSNSDLASDTLLGILSHTTLAMGLVFVSVFGEGQMDLMGYLFGDLLAANQDDIILVSCVSAFVIAILLFLWKPLLSVTIHEELAKVDGIAVTAVRTTLMLLLALVIAIAMKAVGVLLITALLIIPAATSRRLTHTPEQMAIGASILGCIAVMGGLAASYQFDTPAGPSIVLSASVLFLLTLFIKTNR